MLHLASDMLAPTRLPLGNRGGFLLLSRPRAPAWVLLGTRAEPKQAIAWGAAWRPEVLPAVGPAVSTCFLPEAEAHGGPPWAGLSSTSETSHFSPRHQGLAKGPRWIVLKGRNCPIYPKTLLEKHILFYLIHSTR